MRFILTVATALVLATTGAQAANVAINAQFAFNGALNGSKVVQAGDKNFALTGQVADFGGNESFTQQFGKKNGALTLQGAAGGGLNQAETTQVGKRNLAFTGQLALGGYNGASTTQVGKGNLAVTGQLAVNGGENYSSISQFGGGQHAHVEAVAY